MTDIPISTPKFDTKIRSDLFSYIKKSSHHVAASMSFRQSDGDTEINQSQNNSLDEAPTTDVQPTEPLSKDPSEQPVNNLSMEAVRNIGAIDCSFGHEADSSMRKASGHGFSSQFDLTAQTSTDLKGLRSGFDISTMQNLKGKLRGSLSTEFAPKTENTEVTQGSARTNKDSNIGHKKAKERPVFWINLRAISLSLGFLLIVSSISELLSIVGEDSQILLFLKQGLLSLLMLTFSFSVTRRTIFLKKCPTLFSISNKKDESNNYEFPQEYRFYQAGSAIFVLAASFIITSLSQTWNILSRTAIISIISLIICCVLQVAFGADYNKLPKKQNKLGRRPVLETQSSSRTAYNEFVRDIKVARAVLSPETDIEVVFSPKEMGLEPSNSRKASDIVEHNNQRVGHEANDQSFALNKSVNKKVNIPKQKNKLRLPIISLTHIIIGNILIILLGITATVCLAVPLLAMQNSTYVFSLGLMSFAGLPVVYICLRSFLSILARYFRFNSGILVDLLAFLCIMIPFKMVYFVLIEQEEQTFMDVLIFTFAKMGWKETVYAWELYKIHPNSGEKNLPEDQKRMVRDGKLVKLYKRKHINFGVKVTFWQTCDVLISLIYAMILTSLFFNSKMKKIYAVRQEVFIYAVIVLAFDAAIESVAMALLKCIFVKLNPAMKKINFYSNIKTYMRENLSIFMACSACITFMSFNILAQGNSMSWATEV